MEVGTEGGREGGREGGTKVRWEEVREWGRMRRRERGREKGRWERGREGGRERRRERIRSETLQLSPTLTAAGSCPAEEAEVAPAKHQPSMEEEVGQCWHCHKATHTSTHTSSNRYISSKGYIDDCERRRKVKLQPSSTLPLYNNYLYTVTCTCTYVPTSWSCHFLGKRHSYFAGL